MLLLEKAEKHQEGLIHIENWPLSPVQEKGERRNLCESLGFDNQDQEKIALVTFSPNEEFVWGMAFPTIYSYREIRGGPARGRRLQNWKMYDFDIIPTFALREIKKAIDSQLFSDVQIWTPEASQIDPIAVGIRGKETYPIVRWGEALLGTEKIAMMALDRYYRDVPFSEETAEHLSPFVWNGGLLHFFPSSSFKRDRCSRERKPFLTPRWAHRCKGHDSDIHHIHVQKNHCVGVFCGAGEWDCQ